MFLTFFFFLKKTCLVWYGCWFWFCSGESGGGLSEWLHRLCGSAAGGLYLLQQPSVRPAVVLLRRAPHAAKLWVEHFLRGKSTDLSCSLVGTWHTLLSFNRNLVRFLTHSLSLICTTVGNGADFGKGLGGGVSETRQVASGRYAVHFFLVSNLFCARKTDLDWLIDRLLVNRLDFYSRLREKKCDSGSKIKVNINWVKNSCCLCHYMESKCQVQIFNRSKSENKIYSTSLPWHLVLHVVEGINIQKMR